MAAPIQRGARTFPGSGARPRQAGIASPLWLIAAAGAVGILIGISLVVYLTRNNDGPRAQSAGRAREYVVFAQFGLTADVLYEASSDRPTDRRKLLEIPHAREFGIVPSLAPDGRQFAYTVLAPTTPAPAADAPADLWLAPLDGKSKPRLLGQGFDLLVRAVWSRDGADLVLRRSSGGGLFELVRVDTLSGAASTLVTSEAAMFPVAYSPDGTSLYYVSLSARGSDLHHLDFAGRAPALVTHLSNGLTRDWALSPDGKRLAYLALSQDGGVVASQVLVLDITTGSIAERRSGADEFGPAWSPAGALTYGRLSASAGPTGLVVEGQAIAAPARGFEVPVAWSPSGSAIAVRAFEGVSVNAPGRASLSVLTTSGSRRTIANGEVTFLGWTHR